MNTITNSTPPHTPVYLSLSLSIYIYIYIYIRGAFIKFPDFFLYRNLKLLYTLENSVCYCYTSYEMTDQFL